MKPNWRNACVNDSIRGDAGGDDPGHNIPITDIVGCCARAASGHATAALPSIAMRSRRLTV